MLHDFVSDTDKLYSILICQDSQHWNSTSHKYYIFLGKIFAMRVLRKVEDWKLLK